MNAQRVLDIGCGPKRDPRATDGTDYYPYPGVTVVHDLLRFPWPFADGAFDHAVCHQVIEHIPVNGVAGEDPFFRFFDEVWRILGPAGTLEFDVPHVCGGNAFGDPTHRRFFVPETFRHLWDPTIDPKYPRKRWSVERVRVDRVYSFGIANDYHVRKYLPRLHEALVSMGWGRPHEIRFVLRRSVS